MLHARLWLSGCRIDLDAEHAPRNSAFTFHDLPTGKYQVMAKLIGSRGTRATASAWFQAGFDRSR